MRKLFASVDMTEGRPWKKLVAFSIPLLIGNLFQQMYGMADAIILGQLIGDYALAAVGSSIPIFFLIMVLMMGIAMGAGVMVSQYFGAKQREDLSYTIGNCITITAILGVLMTVVGPIFTRPLLILLETPPEVLEDSILYMNILLWGVMGVAYFNILSGILRGLGDAFSPLLYIGITCLLNVALNLLFIMGFGWGMPSVAVGTIISQGFSSVLCFRRLLKMRSVFDMNRQYLRPKKQYMGQALRLGVPTGASQAIIAVATMVVQPLVNDFGPLFLATWVIVMRIDGFVVMPIFSFGNAMTVYAGQNMGAGKIERVSKGVKTTTLISVLTALVLVAVILIFARPVTRIFTQTDEVIRLSQQFLWILAPGYLALSAAMVLWGAIRGAGDAMSPLWASVINTVVIRVPSAFILVHLMGRPEALMYSLLLAWATNLILAIVVYAIGKWKTKGIVKG